MVHFLDKLIFITSTIKYNVLLFTMTSEFVSANENLIAVKS